MFADVYEVSEQVWLPCYALYDKKGCEGPMAGLPVWQASELIIVLLWVWICIFNAGQQGTKPHKLICRG